MMTEEDWKDYADALKNWTSEQLDNEVELLERDLLGDLISPDHYDRSIEIIENEFQRRKNQDDPIDAYNRAMGIL